MHSDSKKLSVLDKINNLSKFMDENDYNLTHFFVQTEIRKSKTHELGRIATEYISKGNTVAIIGGIFVDFSDNYLAMPIGSGLFLHQVNNNRKGTINHSCEPSCIMVGLNKLVAFRDIYENEELSIDYGSTVAGKGHVIIEHCNCGSTKCRQIITTHDYKTLPDDGLSGLAKAVKYNKINL